MSNYLNRVSTKHTPQSQPIPGERQVENDAGGYVYDVGDWARLERFLILGSAGGTYYVSESKLTRDNADLVIALVKEDGHRVVNTIRAVAGRAPKQDPALFALAVAASVGDDSTRAWALHILPDVARTASMLFSFLTYAQQFRGWGRGLRAAVDRWYTEQPVEKLDYQLIKYRNRDGWTHRDVLRKAHVFPGSREQNESLAWAVNKNDGDLEGHPLLVGFEGLQRAATPQRTAEVLRNWQAGGVNLPREAIKPEHLNDPGVWRALLEGGMPQTALLRNLGTMTRVGALKHVDSRTLDVARQLVDPERLRRSRLHPFQILLALNTYASGHGDRGRHTWRPLPQIIDALDAAFYASFSNLEPTGKRFMLGLDVSPSMHSQRIAGSSLSAAQGVGAMAMVTAAVEQHMIFGFTHTLEPLNISPRQRLDDVVRAMRETGQRWGGTDAAQPILAAIRQQIEVDAFVTYTDNETWQGRVHPVQALRQYRQVMGIPAKLVVVGMTATRSTIGDANDPATLDVVGFDSATPSVINDFVKN